MPNDVNPILSTVFDVMGHKIERFIGNELRISKEKLQPISVDEAEAVTAWYWDVVGVKE